MAGNLTSQTPADTYKDLMQVNNSGNGISSTFFSITDGMGVDTALSVSTSGVAIASGLVYKNVDILASPDQINSLNRTYPDGAIEPGKVLVADSAGNIDTSGGSVTFKSVSTSLPFGTLSDVQLGPHSHSMTTHSGVSSTTSYKINTASGVNHKIMLQNSKSKITISSSTQMNRDKSSINSSAYFLRLFFEQDRPSTGFEWAWDSATASKIKWEPTYPSGYGTAASPVAYTSGIPLINDATAVYSGGIKGGHTAVPGEVDIVEMYSLDQGDTWIAKRVASGIV